MKVPWSSLRSPLVSAAVLGLGCILLLLGTLMSTAAGQEWHNAIAASQDEALWQRFYGEPAASPTVSASVDIDERVEVSVRLDFNEDDQVLRDEVLAVLRSSPSAARLAIGDFTLRDASGAVDPGLVTVVSSSAADQPASLTLELVSSELRSLQAPFTLVYLPPADRGGRNGSAVSASVEAG